MKSDFLFILPGPVPIANVRVAEGLKNAFPELTCHLLDCTNELRAKPITLTYLCLRAVVAAGPKALKSRRDLREAIWSSPATEAWIKRWTGKLVSSGQVAFSFQMQSLYDASVPECPHFIFTDHTRLENEKYPQQERGPMPPQKIIDRETKIYTHAKGVFVRSENIRHSLTDQYHLDPDKITVVYAGSNLPEGPPKENARPERDPHTILFVGLDWERKGGPELLDAFRILQRTHPEARLIIAGSTPTVPPELNAVEVIGRVSLEQLVPLYERAGIFCLPTRREPFGIVFLEAMEHNLPVVGTDIGALPDFIRDGETGYQVPVRDPEALAAALRRLCEDPLAAKDMGKRGAQLVRERYNWKSVIAKISGDIRRKTQSD